MRMEWSEEKLLKGIVGDTRRLRFWNKHRKIELLFTQLARYNRMHERVLKYQKPTPQKMAKTSNLSRSKVDIWNLKLDIWYLSFLVGTCLSLASCLSKRSVIWRKRSVIWRLFQKHTFIWRPTLPFKNFSSLHSLRMKFWDLNFWVQKNTFATERSLKFCFV